jgi:hypothetical protein
MPLMGSYERRVSTPREFSELMAVTPRRAIAWPSLPASGSLTVGEYGDAIAAVPRDQGASSPAVALMSWANPIAPLEVDPDRNVLAEQRNDIIAALQRDRHEDAIRHLLHGILWELSGFDSASVTDILVAAGDGQVTYAGHRLGWALADTDLDMNVNPAVALWRELLSRDLPPDAYLGFGRMAINARISDNDWLTLTEATARMTDGRLDEPDRVAEPAGRTPADPRSARIIAHLLADDPKPWDLQQIGAVELEVLNLATGKVATELRERLLDRGFHQALGS